MKTVFEILKACPFQVSFGDLSLQTVGCKGRVKFGFTLIDFCCGSLGVSRRLLGPISYVEYLLFQPINLVLDAFEVCNQLVSLAEETLISCHRTVAALI